MNSPFHILGVMFITLVIVSHGQATPELQRTNDNATPVSADFAGVLKKILEASEREFESIKGEYDFRSKSKEHHWTVNLSIPNANCYMVQRAYWEYVCDLKEKGTRGYERVLGWLRQVTDWDFEPVRDREFAKMLVLKPKGKPFPHILFYHTYGPDIGLKNEVSFSVVGRSRSTGLTTQMPFSRNFTSVEAEIDQISRGRFSPAPTARPQAGATVNGGMVRQTFRNSTYCSLRILLSGPSTQQIFLNPGMSQTITLMAGFYRVAGTCSAPGVLPFYGTDNYQSGNSYSTDFYLQ